MSNRKLKILAVGATGSIGAHVIEQALSQGHEVRALVRRPGALPERLGLEVVVADLTQPQTLGAAVMGVDAVVFTHGTYGSQRDAEQVDYGGVRNILNALDGSNVRVALMTTVAVTDRKGSHDWKRRAERLVRVSGLPYTIVRPGWFDGNAQNQSKLVFLQGDKRQSGTPADGVVSRRQIAKVLVSSLESTQALRKTLELAAETGSEQQDLESLFATLAADPIDSLDAVRDVPNMALDREPSSVQSDMAAIGKRMPRGDRATAAAS